MWRFSINDNHPRVLITVIRTVAYISHTVCWATAIANESSAVIVLKCNCQLLKCFRSTFCALLFLEHSNQIHTLAHSLTQHTELLNLSMTTNNTLHFNRMSSKCFNTIKADGISILNIPFHFWKLHKFCFPFECCCKLWEQHELKCKSEIKQLPLAWVS